jgi:hypothetical protein
MTKQRTVLDMVHGVLADTDRMLKQAAQEAPQSPTPPPGFEKQASGDVDMGFEDMLKVAATCDYLADNLSDIVDDRPATEKLAEHFAIHEQLMAKMAGDEVPPAVPVQGVESALRREAADAPGESLDAGESGEATPAHKPEKETTPKEKVIPADAGNAMETNSEMMMPEQPDDVLKQSSVNRLIDKLAAKGSMGGLWGAQSKNEASGERAGRRIGSIGGAGLGAAGGLLAALKGGERLAAEGLLKNAPTTKQKAIAAAIGVPVTALIGAVAGKHLGGTTGQTVGAMRKTSAENRLIKAASDGQIPHSLAKALLKSASDVDNPASNEAGSNPTLQSAPGVPNVQSQGSEAGENTPRQTAPASGEGGGRNLVASNDAAINATKREALSSTHAALSEVLTEPAMSAAHDKVLQESLVNTPKAGVKIAAARAMLKKFAEQSPENALYVQAMLEKAAQGMQAAPPPAAAATAAPAMGGGGDMVQPAQTVAGAPGAPMEQGAMPQQAMGPEQLQNAALQLVQGQQAQPAAGAAGPGMVAPAPGQVPVQ